MLGTDVPLLLKHVRRLAAATSSDEQLLTEFRACRCEDAFCALINRHGPMVLNVCRRVLHDTHAAEDVFQATFLVLADRAGAIRRPASLAGFLHGVAYRLAVRAKRQSMQNVPAGVCDKSVAPVEALAWKEMLGVLDNELSNLSEQFRTPLVLCYLEGRTQDEAARQLGWSVNTLRRRLTQARRLLEARLRGKGVTLSAAMAGVLAAGAMAVPGSLRAATLAAISTPAICRTAVGASVLASAKNGITLLLTTSVKKVAAVLVILGAAICLATIWASRLDPIQAENEAPPQNLIPIEGAANKDPKSDALPLSSTGRLGTARYRHGTRIETMTVSADGKLAVTASGNSPYNPALAGRFSPARIFDLTDGRFLYSLPNEHGAYSEYPEAVSLSPDGKTLATRDSAKGLSIWDASTGKELRMLKYFPSGAGGRSPTDWLTFTPDSKRVAVTMMGTAVHLVNVETAKVERTFDIAAAARACVFSTDGKLMAAGGYEQENGVYFARLWEVATGKELRRFAVAHQTNQPIGALAFSHDGTKLAGGSWADGRLRVFEVDSGKELHVLPKIGDDIRAIAFSPDGKTVAVAGDNIHLFDPLTGTERLRIARKARTLVFSQDGSVLIGAVSGAIYRWDAASGRQLTPAPGQDSAVEQIMVSADGRSLFTLDQDGDLYAWDSDGKKPTRRIAEGIDRGVVASSDRRFLAWTVPADHGNTRIRLYDIAAERIIDPVLNSKEGFRAIGGAATVTAFMPDGKSLLTFEPRPATFRIWDIESGKEQRSFAAIPPKSVAIHSGGASAEGFDLPVRLWNVATGNAGKDLLQPNNGSAVSDEAGAGTTSYMGMGPRPFCTTRRAALALDGKTLAIGRDWAETFGNRQMKPMDGRAFSPDGRFLVDWAENPLGRSRMDHVYVWDAATGRAVATLAAGTRPGATNAAFSPDGRTLATASADGIVRLWEVATWKVRAEFRGHRDRVTAVAFGPDGRLFTGGLDTVVLSWEVQPPRSALKETIADAWETLVHADAQAGFQAQGRFLAEPDEAVEWLARRLSAAVHPDPGRVNALLSDLDHQDFANRARATAALKEHWPATEAALRQFVTKASSLESRRRAEGIILDMEKAITPPDKLRALRATEVLEWIATKKAYTVLLELTKGTPDAQLTREATAACKRLDERK